MYQDRTESFETVFRKQMLRVPDYQRGFAWEEEHLQDLLDDLELLPAGRDHFTGTIVLHAPDDMPQRIDNTGQKYDVLSIVDGQQRLTSVVLLLDAIRAEMGRFPDMKPAADQLAETYIRVLDEHGRRLPKLRLNEDCHDFYFEGVLRQGRYVKGPTISAHTRLQEARQQFAQYLAKKRAGLGETYPAWLKTLAGKVRHHLRVLVHYVGHEADAGVIFETTNNRGKDITELEKVKNYLLYVARKLEVSEDQVQDLTEKINETWSDIYEALMRTGLEEESHEDRLLRVHWFIAYNPRRQDWDGSDSIKDHFGLRRTDYREDAQRLYRDLVAYLDTFESCIIPYCDVYRPTHPNAFNAFKSEREERRRAFRLGRKLVRLRLVAPFLPLLLAVRIRYPHGAKEYAQTVELCEKFAFRVYRLQDRRSNTGRSMFRRVGRAVLEGQDLEAALDTVRTKLFRESNDAQFRRAFELQEEDNNWYRWRGIRYLLYEYEEHLAAQEGVPPEDIGVKWSQVTGEKAKTVEHILPQTPGADGYWQTRFDETLQRKYRHDLGNLSLCLPEENSWLSNKPFPEKKGKPGQPAGEPKGYVNSSFHMQRRLGGYRHWNEQNLLDRRRRIVEWAKERWYVEPPPPPPDVGKLEKLYRRAEENRIDSTFRKVVEWAREHQRLYIKRNSRSVEIRPYGHRYTLLTVWPKPGKLRLLIRLKNFVRVFPVGRDETEAILGSRNRRDITEENVDVFLDNLDQIFTLVEEKAEQ